jgi:hypothetical protein
MTKKTTYLILAVILIAALLFLYKSTQKEALDHDKAVKEAVEAEEKVRAIEKAIPDGGIMYANLIDMKGVYDDISKTNFYKKFTALKVFDSLKAEVEKFNKEQVFDLSFENTLKLIGNDFFVSLYFKEGSEKPVVLITTVLDDSVSYLNKMFDFFTDITQTKEQDDRTGKETYNGVDINYAVDKGTGKRFYYLIIDNIAHFATSLDIMKNVVDLSQDKKKNSLSKSETYAKVKTKFRPGNFSNMYFDIKSLVGNIRKMFDKQVKTSPQQLGVEQTFEQFASYDALYMDAVVDKGVDMSMTITMREGATGDYIKFLDSMHGDPKVDSFSDLIKTSPLFYASYNSISIPEYYNNMNTLYKNFPENPMKAFEDGVKETLGLSVTDELLPLFGDEIFYACTGINTTATFFPVPDFFIGVKITDVNKFNEVLGKVNDAIVKASPNISMKEDEYNGNRYSYAFTPYGIAPGHGIAGDYYVIFASSSAFTGIVDTLGSDAVSYFKSDKFKPLKKHVHGNYHYFSYMDSKQFFQLIPGLFDQYSPLLQGSMTNEQRREFLTIYNDQALPLIETLKVSDRSVSTGYYDKDKKQFVFKGIWKVEDIK